MALLNTTQSYVVTVLPTSLHFISKYCCCHTGLFSVLWKHHAFSITGSLHMLPTTTPLHKSYLFFRSQLKCHFHREDFPRLLSFIAISLFPSSRSSCNLVSVRLFDHEPHESRCQLAGCAINACWQMCSVWFWRLGDWLEVGRGEKSYLIQVTEDY